MAISQFDILTFYFDLLCEKCNEILSEFKDIEIVSGHANGADKLGERYAKENNLKLTLFPANWDLNGKSAGYIRNYEMAKYADVLIAFWDGKSKGTMDMISQANKRDLIVIGFNI